MTAESLTHCHECGHKLAILESRIHIIGTTQTVRRRKSCPDCGGKLMTIEIPEAIGVEVLTDD